MNLRNDAIRFMGILVLLSAGLGYARSPRAGPPGQDAAKSEEVVEPTEGPGAQPDGAAASVESRRDAGSTSADGRVAPEVYTALEGSADATAYVVITLKPDHQETPTPEQVKDSVKRVQDKVLAKMAAGEFKVVYRFETTAVLIGHVSSAGVAKLAADPNVVTVSPSKIEAEVFPKLQSSEDGTVHVIVNLTRVSEGAPASHERKALVKQIQDRVLDKLAPGEFKIEWVFQISGGFSGHINAAGLGKLATDPDVVSVGVPGVMTLDLNQSVPFIRADQVHDLGYTGAGVTVALLDSGVDCTHPDVQGSCADGAATFLGGWPRGGAPDDVGHGTYMAAIITADNGVAPVAKVLPIKIADASGIAPVADIVKAINHVVDTKDSHSNLRVINLSLSSPTLYAACPPCDPIDTDTQALGGALDEARAAGIVSLASSGQAASCGTIALPACVSSAVAVTGVYDLVYPGVDYGMCQDLAPQPHLVMCVSNRATLDCD